MYSVTGYGDMIADQPRMAAYNRALRDHIRPDSVVLDLGAGPGVHALMACQYGARRVHAIEPEPVIQLARAFAEANGFADRIEFHAELSTAINLDEPADVIVADLGGVLPLFQQHIPSIIDARKRLLSPDGVLIRQHDVLKVAVVEATKRYSRLVGAWDHNAYGFDLSRAKPYVLNRWMRGTSTRDQLLVAPQTWAELDYRSIDDPNVSGEVQWTVERAGTAHGLALWFDARLAGGVGFSNAPGETELIYGQAYFPLEQPLSLSPGDALTVQIAANMVGGEYQWRWNTSLEGYDREAACDVQLRQSTFRSTFFSPEVLRKREAAYRPELSADGRLAAFVMAEMDRKPHDDARSSIEIARRLAEREPERFATEREALDWVTDLVLRYSR